ncbi:Uncharacterised protein [Niallia circulans]|jgi:hypothetical protein|uniref:hypothetical protein n=1 Tax=Niallia circulans TaxID=1397 RepID=UPI00077C4507|nr:hypothetical protein [Niallia circulans]MDR4317903.1 hypothetical protein [Niallia circulans]MED3840962.1 hypothetical protein [Niallia circulans]MED4242324.1 hypothetical protein [Niallia circulans]MED4250974.1 hypothetical protein [Niallia circulans]QKH62318.1 hypothetical protein FOC77_17535 [Niallia circulans]
MLYKKTEKIYKDTFSDMKKLNQEYENLANKNKEKSIEIRESIKTNSDLFAMKKKSRESLFDVIHKK